MHRVIKLLVLITVIITASCNQNSENSGVKTNAAAVDNVSSFNNPQLANGDIKPSYLTVADFKIKVWDYEANPEEWIYKGELPCVIDFYADWCKPCKMVAPIMDELADHYKGRVIIYKVNTDKEKELASVFRVNSIPSVLFSPATGKPAMQPGALTKEDYIRIIDEFVLKINGEKS
jgi:thioredoxin